ncbi:MAG TPA: hypothetical protein VFL57_18315 [Bryobacteraceae bacterium]|nr:hypothetical protein [Bryobacteraceae bacterium]
MPRKKPKSDRAKEVRAIARERLGAVPPSRPLDEKPFRRKPKHKKTFEDDLTAERQ